MFSKLEQKAIDEKLSQLKQLKEGKIYPRELAEIITKRRIEWANKNLSRMLKKYDDLDIKEKAHKIIYLEHMKINSEDSKLIELSENKLLIKSYNFCPYLEACKILGIDTQFVCKEIGEPSIHKMLFLIDSDLKFSRNYSIIRPSAPFCEEYIEKIKK